MKIIASLLLCTALAAAQTGKTVTLTWTENDPSHRVAQYRVTRGATKNGTFEILGYTTATVYKDATVTQGKTYFYRVRAITKSGIIGDFSGVEVTVK
jgi:fibronectin type 3 domain-containing protein